MERRGGDDSLVVALVEGDDTGGAEERLRGAACSGGHGLEERGVAEDGDGAGGHAVDVADSVEKTVGLASVGAIFAGAIIDEFGNAADTGGNGGDTAGHGFEGGEAEGL